MIKPDCNHKSEECRLRWTSIMSCEDAVKLSKTKYAPEIKKFQDRGDLWG